MIPKQIEEEIKDKIHQKAKSFAAKAIAESIDNWIIQKAKDEFNVLILNSFEAGAEYGYSLTTKTIHDVSDMD